MREALSDMTGSPLPDWVWLKASLPPSLRGLNLRHMLLLHILALSITPSPLS